MNEPSIEIDTTVTTTSLITSLFSTVILYLMLIWPFLVWIPFICSSFVLLCKCFSSIINGKRTNKVKEKS